MIDAELVAWAAMDAATASRTDDHGAIVAPDLDIEAVTEYGARAGQWGIRRMMDGFTPDVVIAAMWSQGFCAGVAAGRAEVTG